MYVLSLNWRLFGGRCRSVFNIEELEENSIYDGEVVYALEYRKPCSKVCDWNFTAFHHIFCKFCALRSRMEIFTKYLVQKIRVSLRQSEGLFYARIKKKKISVLKLRGQLWNWCEQFY